MTYRQEILMRDFATVPEREFASALETMTDEELFELMADLERRSEASKQASSENEVFAKIVLTERAIEKRFPGQMLVPYKDWKNRPDRLAPR
ncbi:hypothetical protein FHT78_001322 [Rhizobium sp. BK196]|jgi:hypothetical protein|uniref:hypothetical protein n=1 Tax=Rhizobium sp. BK196 TaxID=2587073 RepID=UPI00183A82AA|nr:hypothetical protein [Rhizobium sp. BK196]MBB3309593.1 hypothetical protein [Rhizobium sp. BK196]